MGWKNGSIALPLSLCALLGFACEEGSGGSSVSSNSLAMTAEDAGSMAEPPMHGPPAQAVEACAALAEDAECSFTMPSRAVDGTCRLGPEGETLACMPDRLFHRNHRQPPPEVFAACSALEKDAECSFTIRDHTVSGTCRPGPEGETLACVPDHPFHRNHRQPPPEVFAACSALEADATCHFTLPSRTVEGTCRPGPEGQKLACMPGDMGPGHMGPGHMPPPDSESEK